MIMTISFGSKMNCPGVCRNFSNLGKREVHPALVGLTKSVIK